MHTISNNSEHLQRKRKHDFLKTPQHQKLSNLVNLRETQEPEQAQN